MTVQDYAESMNYTVQDVLNKCKELGIKATQKDDMLDDDAIVMLDNTMFSLDDEDDLQIETEDEEIIVDRMMELCTKRGPTATLPSARLRCRCLG